MYSPALSYQGQVPMPMPVYRAPAVLPWAFPPTRRRAPMQAAIAFVASGVASTGGTTLTYTWPSVSAHDTAILFCASGGGDTGEPGNGFVRVYTDRIISGSIEGVMWVKADCSGSESGTFNLTVPASETRGVIQIFSGLDNSDPFLAWRGHHGSFASSKAPDALYFQPCDFYGVSFSSAGANIAAVVPTGWTQAGQSTGGGGGGRSVGGGYKSFTNTEGLSGVGAWTMNTPGSVVVAALRASGNKVLSLKSASYDGGMANNSTQAGSSTSSVGISLPPFSNVGDMIVCLVGWKLDANTTNPTLTGPTSYSQKGTDQLYRISAVPAYSAIGAGLFYKVLTGSNDSPTISTSIAVTLLQGVCLCYSTGSTGLDPALPGTMGQANDTSSNTTADIPAMTLEDYADDNILGAWVVIELGNIAVSGANGWDWLGGRSQSTAGDQNSGYLCKMNSGADPAASTVTLSGGNRSVGLQWAVVIGPAPAVGVQAGFVG